MQIVLPPDIERKPTQADAALHLAIGLFVDKRVTLGQGASVAGLSVPAFLAEIGKRRIPVHYELEDAIADIETVANMPVQ
jgi:predicted HTH domain antitoxin